MFVNNWEGCEGKASTDLVKHELSLESPIGIQKMQVLRKKGKIKVMLDKNSCEHLDESKEIFNCIRE